MSLFSDDGISSDDEGYHSDPGETKQLGTSSPSTLSEGDAGDEVRMKVADDDVYDWEDAGIDQTLAELLSGEEIERVYHLYMDAYLDYYGITPTEEDLENLRMRNRIDVDADDDDLDQATAPAFLSTNANPHSSVWERANWFDSEDDTVDSDCAQHSPNQSTYARSVFDQHQLAAQQLQSWLSTRPSETQLLDQNILKESHMVAPSLHNVQANLKRQRLERTLNQRLENRPSVDSLIGNNIIKSNSQCGPGMQEALNSLERARIEAKLEKGLENRPSQTELKLRHILPASESSHDYDRDSEQCSGSSSDSSTSPSMRQLRVYLDAQLEARSSRANLVNRNIMKSVNAPKLQAAQSELNRRILENMLQHNMDKRRSRTDLVRQNIMKGDRVQNNVRTTQEKLRKHSVELVLSSMLEKRLAETGHNENDHVHSDSDSDAHSPSTHDADQHDDLVVLVPDQWDDDRLNDMPVAEVLDESIHLNWDSIERSLETKLNHRPRIQHLQQRNILQSDRAVASTLHDAQASLKRHLLEDSLEAKLEHRPDQEQLVHRGIMHSPTHARIGPMVRAQQNQIRKHNLESKLDNALATRPHIQELIHLHILELVEEDVQALRLSRSVDLEAASSESLQTTNSL